MRSIPLRRLPHDTAPWADLLAQLSERFAATAEAHDRADSFPHDNFTLLQAHGLVSLVVPRERGGAGGTLQQAREVVAAVARGEPATSLVLTMTYLQHQLMAALGSRWPAHLRDQVERDAVQHGALINSLRVEPLLGSPGRGDLPATAGQHDADGWRIDGHKLYTTGISALSWLSVWGRTDEPEPRVGVFLVPRETPGIRVVESWDHLGLRASGSHEVVFEMVRIPHDHAVDLRPPAAWAAAQLGPQDAATHARQQIWMTVLLGALYDSVARAARDWLAGFLHRRAPGSLGAALATLPRAEEIFGEIEALLRTNRVLLDDAARSVDQGVLPSPADAGLLKFTVTGNAVRAAERCDPGGRGPRCAGRLRGCGQLTDGAANALSQRWLSRRIPRSRMHRSGRPAPAGGPGLRHGPATAAARA